MVLLSLTACNRNRPPKEIIMQDELVPILVDLHMVYALQGSILFKDISRSIDSVDTYSLVFEKHGINKALFDTTIAWYSQHPKIFTHVYDHVVMQLTQLSDSISPNAE
ncbi:DUF4296 domain-containing protein [Bacteroidota bacterium]